MVSLEIVILLLSMAISGCSAYFLCLATNWTFFWTAFIFLPISYLLLFALWVLFLILWGFCINKKKEVKKFSRFYYHIIRVTDTMGLHLCKISWKMNGFEKMPKNHDFVIVSNHVSNFDQMIIIAALKKINQPMAWVTKPENMDFPIAGPFIHASGYIPIDRENPINGVKAIKKGVEYLKTHQCAVGICPEGTRNKTDAPLLEFHPGSFKMAVWANVPIVVVCLRGTKEIKKRAPWRRSRCELDLVDVITPEEYQGKTTAEISSRAREAILKDLERK